MEDTEHEMPDVLEGGSYIEVLQTRWRPSGNPSQSANQPVFKYSRSNRTHMVVRVQIVLIYLDVVRIRVPDKHPFVAPVTRCGR